jgi:hypothetical protein
MKKTVLVLLAGAALFTACRKSDSTTSKTTQEKMLGKWSVVSQADSAYYNGALHYTMYTGVSTDYVDFRTDGKVYSNYQNQGDTSTYKVIDDSHFVLNSLDTALIKTLTDNSFVMYIKSTSGANWDAVSTTLKK